MCRHMLDKVGVLAHVGRPLIDRYPESTAPVAKKHALLFVTVTVFLDTMGFGVFMPVMPQLGVRVVS